jgi:phage gp36-like protein
MAYATASQVIARFDVRELGQLAVDDNTELTSGGLASSARLQACIDDATADIDDALRSGYRYTSAELASLSSASNKTLIRICADLTLAYMYRARGRMPSEYHQRAIDDTKARLNDLRDGKTVLHGSTNQDVTTKTTVPTTSERSDLGMMSDSSHFRSRRSEIA